ncbi:MAG: hypothetical protein HGA47_11195 [Zoogloea sp.]|nr:hypothetical protein [Zoogloea sp.]
MQIKKANEYRLSADVDEIEEGGVASRRISLVGLNRRSGGGYGDCKVGDGDLKPLAYILRGAGRTGMRATMLRSSGQSGIESGAGSEAG